MASQLDAASKVVVFDCLYRRGYLDDGLPSYLSTVAFVI